MNSERAAALSHFLVLSCITAGGLAALPCSAGEPVETWAVIGNPGNVPFDGTGNPLLAGRGSVGYVYRIGRLEVTSGEWLEFINIFAPQSEDPFWFLRPSFSGIVDAPQGWGHYELRTDVENAAMLPVIGISWRDAAMYCNWLHNGKRTDWDAIMGGAYDATTFATNPDGTFNDQATHSPDAKFWIPTLDEWMKAAHYDPHRYGTGLGGWWLYSNSSDSPPVPGEPGSGETSAGEFESRILHQDIPLGSYPDTQSPSGLLDLSGGAPEWTEEINYAFPWERVIDGSWAGCLNADISWDLVYVKSQDSPSSSFYQGLRIATRPPESPFLPRASGRDDASSAGAVAD